MDKNGAASDDCVDLMQTAVPKQCEEPKSTMSVGTMAKMLGLHKTESYWLVHKNYFDMVVVNGKMRIDLQSFEKWYSNQVKYKKVSGAPPGEQLRRKAYDVHDISKMLNISESSAYDLMNKIDVSYTVVNGMKRWDKDEFYNWYASQNHYRTQEDIDHEFEIIETSISIPEIGWLLGIHRNTVYGILDEERLHKTFDFVYIGDKKRVTKESFLAWYKNQSRYRMVFETIEDAQADKARSLKMKPVVKKNTQAKETRSRFPSNKKYNSGYYSVEEIAEFLGLSPNYVKRKIKKGLIPGKKIAGKIIINRLDFDRWAIEKKIGADLTHGVNS